MTWRLALGALMLERRSIMFPLAMIALMGRSGSMPLWLQDGTAVLVAGIASIFATSALSTRTISVLPLDSRDINRATWVLTAVVPVLVLAVARLLSATVAGAFEDPSSWRLPVSAVQVFSECLFFAMAGAWSFLMPDRDSPEARMDFVGLFLTVAGVLGVMGVPFVVLMYLPATFGDISPAGWLLTGVAVVLAATPLFLPPKQYVRPDSRRLATEEKAPKPAIMARPERAPRVTGVWALTPLFIAYALAWTAVFITFQLGLDWSRDRDVFLQPFDPGLPARRFLLHTSFLLLFVIGFFPGLGSRVPMLKLLPIAPTRAAAAMTVAPMATPVVFWLALILIHIAVSTAWPGTLRLNHLLCLMGLAALVDAIGIKSGSPLGKYAAGAPIILALGAALDGDRASAELMLQHWLVPVVGVVSLALAYALNLHTMTRAGRGSRAYRYAQAGTPQGAR